MNDEESASRLTDLDREAKVYAVLGDLTAGSVRKTGLSGSRTSSISRNLVIVVT